MLKELKKWLSKEKNDKNIFDIVLYGSSVKGKSKPNDLDILIIFKEGKLKERLEKSQQIKKKIQFNGKIDIKNILWEEMFQAEFFARSGIFLAGISVFDNKPLAKKMGFESHSLFVYNLKDKTHNEKVKFNYILSGRNSEGIIKKLSGKHLAPGVVQIPIKNSLEFEEVLKKSKINYSKSNIMIEK